MHCADTPPIHAFETKFETWHSESSWNWHEKNHMNNHFYARGEIKQCEKTSDQPPFQTKKNPFNRRQISLASPCPVPTSPHSNPPRLHRPNTSSEHSEDVVLSVLQRSRNHTGCRGLLVVASLSLLSRFASLRDCHQVGEFRGLS